MKANKYPSRTAVRQRIQLIQDLISLDFCTNQFDSAYVKNATLKDIRDNKDYWNQKIKKIQYAASNMCSDVILDGQYFYYNFNARGFKWLREEKITNIDELFALSLVSDFSFHSIPNIGKQTIKQMYHLIDRCIDCKYLSPEPEILGKYLEIRNNRHNKRYYSEYKVSLLDS